MDNIISKINDQILSLGIKSSGIAIYKVNDNNFDIFIQKFNSKFIYYFEYNLISFKNFYGEILPLSNSNLFEIDIKELVEHRFVRFLEYIDFYINNNFDFDSSNEEDNNINTEELIDLNFDHKINEYSQIAHDFYNTNEFENSINYYNMAIALNPYDANLYAGKANCFNQLNEFSFAINETCKAALTNPTNTKNIYRFSIPNIAYSFKLRKDYYNSIKYYNFAIDIGNELYFLEKRAYCYAQIKKYELSIIDIKRAIQIDYKIDHLYQLAEIYIMNNDLISARNTLNEVLNFTDIVSFRAYEIHIRQIKEKAKFQLQTIN